MGASLDRYLYGCVLFTYFVASIARPVVSELLTVPSLLKLSPFTAAHRLFGRPVAVYFISLDTTALLYRIWIFLPPPVAHASADMPCEHVESYHMIRFIVTRQYPTPTSPRGLVPDPCHPPQFQPRGV